MELVTKKEFQELVNFNRLGSNLFVDIVFQLLKFDKMNELYSKHHDKSATQFIDDLFDNLEIKFEIPDSDLLRIPKKDAFITVSNHPYGGLDGLILYKIISSVRPDYKVMANFLLQKIDPLKDCFFPVNPFEAFKEKKSSFSGLRHALDHVIEDHPLGIFPAGEVSTYNFEDKRIIDKQWSNGALKFIMNCEVPVVPVYFSGNNSILFHMLGQLHPMLRTAKLPSELFNKKEILVQVRIGKPISVKEQDNLGSVKEYGRYLRARTYCLGNSLEINNFYKKPFMAVKQEREPIMNGVLESVLVEEFKDIEHDYMLMEMKNFKVFCAPADRIPNIIHEIGRLREITFREIGEGTNKSIDLDQYDVYFHHLVIWDEEARKIVGAYRIGKGKDIIEQFGIRGFYVRSLFKIHKGMKGILSESLELGRSFIVKEYQRKPLSLYLLWKGIFHFLIMNNEYRYLVGPVSISSEFSSFSKSLMVALIRSKYFNEELSLLIKPKKNYKIPKKFNDEIQTLIKDSDIDKIDNIINELETGLKMPVLLKKYLSLNARIIGFNVDPLFNNCIDGLMILDLFNVPQEVVKSFSKEMLDEKSEISKITLLRTTFGNHE